MAEKPTRLIIPSPDARVARSPFRDNDPSVFDTGTVQAASSFTFLGSIQPLAGETFTIDGKTYEFTSPVGAADGDILIGASIAATIQNCIDAMNLTGTPGVQYAAATTLHPTAFAGPGTSPAWIATAKTPGIVGNLIPLSETLINGSWGGGAFLAGGLDGAVAFVPIVQWGSIRIRVRIEGSFGELGAVFSRPARNKAPNTDGSAFLYTVDQPAIDETFLADGVAQSLEIPTTEHIGENWLKLSVSCIDPPSTVIDFCDISGVLLGLYH